jgi:hypothetical protein
MWLGVVGRLKAGVYAGAGEGRDPGIQVVSLALYLVSPLLGLTLLPPPSGVDQEGGVA